MIAGEWPQVRFPSSSENNGILLDLASNRGKHGYGIEAFEAGNPLAWPSSPPRTTYATCRQR